MIKNKRILCAGGAGSIGSEIVRQLAPKNKIFILDIDETSTFDLAEELRKEGFWVYYRVGDITDKDTVRDVFSDFKPQIVFNAAARKHVTPNEIYPEEAIQTNVIGTYNLIKEAKNWECFEKFVFISTDKAVQSSSIMGATKRLGEIMVKNQGKGFVVVRFGNVMGSRGSVIPIWQKQIYKGQAITVTDKEMERFFMTIEDAISLVIGAAEMGNGGEIIILDMGEPIKVLELAKNIIKGTDIQIDIIGSRPGEVLKEKLMFDEELKVAKKIGKYFVIK